MPLCSTLHVHPEGHYITISSQKSASLYAILSGIDISPAVTSHRYTASIAKIELATVTSQSSFSRLLKCTVTMRTVYTGATVQEYKHPRTRRTVDGPTPYNVVGVYESTPHCAQLASGMDMDMSRMTRNSVQSVRSYGAW